MKTDELILLAALGLGGFILYQHSQQQSAAALLAAQRATLTPAPALALPPPTANQSTGATIGQIVDTVGHIWDAGKDIFGKIF